MRKFLWRIFSLTLFFTLISTGLIVFVIEKFTFSIITEVLFAYNFQNYPLIFYLIGVSSVLAIIFSLWLSSVERRVLAKTARALKKLVNNEIHDPLFIRMFSKDTPVQINKKIDQLMLDLHEKISLMAQESRLSKEEATKINPETREEILEGERHRIARELHDSVSQQLFASSMMLSALTEQSARLPKEIAQQLELIQGITSESQSEMRALLLHLRPVQLKDKSLKEGIEQLLTELKTKVQMEIHYKVEDIKMPPSFEDHLFRIVQELISNVLRHAKANEIELYLTKNIDAIQLRVVDDGVGFDYSTKKTGSYGLQNIKERVEGVGGKVKVVSIKSEGTSVAIDLPIGMGEI